MHRGTEPIQQLRFSTAVVRDQEAGGSNPLAPTICFQPDNVLALRQKSARWFQSGDASRKQEKLAGFGV